MSFYNLLLKWAEKVCEEDRKDEQRRLNLEVFEFEADNAKERRRNGETCKNCRFCEITWAWGLFSKDKYYCKKT